MVNDQELDFFHQNLAEKLDGQFGSDFWSRLVLQLSHTEPAVRHAISAVSIICNTGDSSGWSTWHPAEVMKSNPYAEHQKNKAIRLLSNRIQAKPDSNLVPLICCLLFTCIEFLRGNIENSMLHVENGYRILTAIRGNGAAASPSSSSPSIELDMIEEQIVPVFARLHIVCSLAGRMISPLYSPFIDDESPHQDFADSRRRLFEISDVCIRFVHDRIPRAVGFQINMDDFIKQAKLKILVDRWRNGLDESVQRMQAAGEEVNWNGYNLMIVHYKVIFIWLRTCVMYGEGASDAYHADFQELVHHAEQVVETIDTPQPLAFDLHILGPLYFTAMKCRFPTTRRRALELLRLAPRREGLWNAHHAYVTLRRVIELEERNLNGKEVPDESDRIHGFPLPDDDDRRLDSAKVPHLIGRGQNVSMSPARAGKLQAVFQMKPWGLLGQWQSITEYIELEEV